MYYKVDLTRQIEEKCTILVKIDSAFHQPGDKKFVYDLLTRDLTKNLDTVSQVVFHEDWRVSNISGIKVQSITNIDRSEYLSLNLEAASQSLYKSVGAKIKYS